VLRSFVFVFLYTAVTWAKIPDVLDRGGSGAVNNVAVSHAGGAEQTIERACSYLMWFWPCIVV